MTALVYEKEHQRTLTGDMTVSQPAKGYFFSLIPRNYMPSTPEYNTTSPAQNTVPMKRPSNNASSP
jgi:hypothetical protein